MTAKPNPANEATLMVLQDPRKNQAFRINKTSHLTGYSIYSVITVDYGDVKRGDGKAVDFAQGWSQHGGYLV